MIDSRSVPKNISPENFQRLYDGLSESEKTLIAAWMNMSFALLQSVSAAQNNKKGKGA